MTRSAFAGLCLVVACTSPPPPPVLQMPPCSQSALGGGPPDGLFRVENEDAVVKVQHPVVCSSSFDVTATVSVVGPDNEEVPLSQDETRRPVAVVAGNLLETSVIFRPTKAGPYHLTARFDPNLGASQRDIIAAENRRDARPDFVVVSSSPLGPCRRIDVTEEGRLLCLVSPIRLFDTAGNVTRDFGDASAAARGGKVLWLLEDAGTLTRWLEGDAGFVALDDGGMQHGLVDPVLAADSEGAVLATQNVVLWLTATGGQELHQLPMGPRVGRAIAAWKSSEHWAVFLEQPSGVQELCSGSTRDAGACVGLIPLTALALGSSADGIWAVSANPPFMSSERVRLLTDGAERTLVVPRQSWPSIGPAQWNSEPWLYDEGQGLVVRATDSGIGLQKFTDLEVLGVTREWVTLRAANGDVQLYRRR